MASLAERSPAPLGQVLIAPDLLTWLTAVDHKRIGVLYLAASAVFFALGGVEALAMRLQLAWPGLVVLDPDGYNRVFTMHGTTMIFLAIMPALLGFANYVVPLQIGARDMAFPRLNALSLWLFVFGGLVLYLSFLSGTPPNAGWFAYAPLTEHPYSMDPGVDYWIVGLLVSSAGTIATAVNLVVTIVKLRAPGMTAGRLPVFVWMSLITALLILWALPSLAAAQLLLLLDRLVGTHFFDVAHGGDPLLWQHLFWFFGHPEVYILVLPAFGIISEVIPVFSRKPIFGYSFVVGSGIAIAFYSFLVWAHHMFAVGLGLVLSDFFGATSMVIAVPTGIKIFSWLGTMWGGRLRLETAMLFALGFIVVFVLGGVTGVQFAMVPIDLQLTDSYYVVAHFHYIMVGGSLMALFAATYYWFPKITGRRLDERLGRWHFWTTFVAFNVTFLPMHVLGLMGMPRRVYTYPDLPGWGPLNLLETIGAFVLGLSTLLLLYNLVASARSSAPAGDNPWEGWTLEWATSSPPPAHNFEGLPPITSARPLWDLAHRPRALAAPAEDAARPGDPSGMGGRGDGPAAGAMGGRGDGPAARASTGRLDLLPSPVLGTLAFISSEMVLFGALLVVFLEYRARTTGEPGPGGLDVPRTVLFSLALFASSATMSLAGRRLRAGDRRGLVGWLVATIALGGLFLLGQATEYARLLGEGFTPDRNLFTGAFFALTGLHGLHVTLGLLVLAVLAWLAVQGAVHRRRPAAVEAVAAYWHFVDGIWVVLLSVIYLWNLV